MARQKLIRHETLARREQNIAEIFRTTPKTPSHSVLLRHFCHTERRHRASHMP